MTCSFTHFPGEISGLRLRSPLARIRGCFPNYVAQRNFVPNSVASDKNIRNTSLLEKKVFFHVFRARWMRIVLDIFVEWIQLYHNLAVHAKYVFIYEDTGLDKKTTTSVGKQVVPNSELMGNFILRQIQKSRIILTNSIDSEKTTNKSEVIIFVRSLSN